MSTPVHALLLTWTAGAMVSSFSGGVATPPACLNSSGILSPPTDVQLISRNMDLVLRWSAPSEACGGLVYTAERWSKATGSAPGCVNVTERLCDLFGPGVSLYGTYTGRVQATWGPYSSNWAQSNAVTIDKDTVIGPPNVTLLSSGRNLEVFIKDPVFKKSSLMEVYHQVSFNITYWKDGHEAAVSSIDNIKQNRVLLDNLDSSSRYCVQVRIDTRRNRKPSVPSDVACENTGDAEKNAPWLAAAVLFVVMVTVVSLVVVLMLRCKNIPPVFYPKDSITRTCKEVLLKPIPSYIKLDLQPAEEISYAVTLEERGREESGGRTEERGAGTHRTAMETLQQAADSEPQPSIASLP